MGWTDLMALGADRLGVLRMILGQVAATTAAGLAVGVPATLALSRIVESQLYGIPAHDASSILAAAAGVTVVALLAAFFPARRASRVVQRPAPGRSRGEACLALACSPSALRHRQCNVSRNSPVDASMNTDKPAVPTDSPQIMRQAGFGYCLLFSSSMEMVRPGCFLSYSPALPSAVL